MYIIGLVCSRKLRSHESTAKKVIPQKAPFFFVNESGATSYWGSNIMNELSGRPFCFQQEVFSSALNLNTDKLAAQLLFRRSTVRVDYVPDILLDIIGRFV
uniref:Uncharacterized protein n=1 Tax=Arundo donax TaxID=35708 RepID=A0A0A9CW55_ARUDO